MQGGSFNLEEPPPEEPGMLMTSMIDIIFILLAFFVCVTELKKGTLEVDVPEVPAVDAPEPEDEPAEPIVVEVTSDNKVFVAGTEAVDAEQLDRLLAKVVEEYGAGAPVYLSGDQNAKNGTMMRVVSHLSRAGITRIEFAVQMGG